MKIRACESKRTEERPVYIRVEQDYDDVNIYADGNLIAWLTPEGELYIACDDDGALERLGFTIDPHTHGIRVHK
jgi:hypothetical protein